MKTPSCIDLIPRRLQFLIPRRSQLLISRRPQLLIDSLCLALDFATMYFLMMDFYLLFSSLSLSSLPIDFFSSIATETLLQSAPPIRRPSHHFDSVKVYTRRPRCVASLLPIPLV